jgi:tRNA threonylcarbamoyladenosine biosynthesis protein TsaE
VGEKLGRVAVRGLIVALQGPLGAGKTVFTKGIARGLDVPVPRYVSSPTFTIHKLYQGRLTLHHLDLYRLTGAGQLEDLGLEDALGGSGVCVIEWPDSFFEVIPHDRLVVRFLLDSPEERSLEIEASGPRSAAVWGYFREALRLEDAREDS